MNINCTGCGGVHPRLGGSLCRNLAFRKNTGHYEAKSMGATAADTNSKMAASGVNRAAILPADELATMPDRTSDEYMAFCEKVIGELSHKVEASEEESKVLAAENKICELMSQLHMSESSRERKLSRRDSRAGSGLLLPDVSPDPHSHLFRTVVVPTDSKDYLSKLRAEAHLTPLKNYEAMNYRDLVLGMAGVHNHLLFHGHPVDGYEAHCLFENQRHSSTRTKPQYCMTDT